MYKINEDLLNSFKTDVFKSLQPDAKQAAIKNLSFSLFEINNLEPIKIIFDKSVGLGSYSHYDLKDPNDFLIKYGERFLFEDFEWNNYFALASVIHEVEHYRQEIEEPEKYLQTLKSPTTGLGLYMVQIHEKDAHIKEIEILKSLKDFFNDPEFDKFIKHEESFLDTKLNEEKNKLLGTGFIENSYTDTINEIVNIYSKYQEPINEVLKCTSGRKNFVNRNIDTKNIKGVIVETDLGWSGKLITKDEPPHILEFGLNKGICKISRFYEYEKFLDFNLSRAISDDEKLRLLSFIPSIIKEYEKQTKQDINCLSFCPCSIDDKKTDYNEFIYSLVHRKTLFEKLFKKGVPEKIPNEIEYNLKENKEISKEISKNFENVAAFNKKDNIISDIFNDKKLDELLLSEEPQAAKEIKDKNIDNATR